MAIAKSKKIAIPGHVNLDIAKKEAWRPSVRDAHWERKNRPIPEAAADNMTTRIPGIKPIDANAAGWDTI